MNCLAVDRRMNAKSKSKLIELGYNLIELPENNCYDIPISAHPDIFVCKIKEQLFVDSSVNDLFTKLGEACICNRGVPKNKIYKYPEDVLLNCAYFGNKLICNEKYTYPKIIEFAKENNIKIIDVAQGYSKCSTIIVDDNSIITDDDSICNAAIENRVNVLKIKKGYVKLNGYEYGFIGGCCGLINNILVFNGKIENHPDYLRIRNFCSRRNVEILSLCNEELYDVGSIIAI